MSRWIHTASRLGDLKVPVRNNASNGERAKSDRVPIVVTYHEP